MIPRSVGGQSVRDYEEEGGAISFALELVYLRLYLTRVSSAKLASLYRILKKRLKNDSHETKRHRRRTTTVGRVGV